MVSSQARSLLRTIAPMRTPLSVISIFDKGSGLMSTNVVGDSTLSFMKSRRFVPPPRNLAPGSRLTCSTAADGSSARMYENGTMVTFLRQQQRQLVQVDSEFSDRAAWIAATMFGYAPHRQRLPLIASRT